MPAVPIAAEAWKQLDNVPPVGFALQAVDVIALILQGKPAGGQSVRLDGLEFLTE